MTLPASSTVSTLASFVIANNGFCPNDTVSSSVAGPDSSESAVAVLSTFPASISACVITYEAVNVVVSVSPTSSVVGPPDTVTKGSETVYLGPDIPDISLAPTESEYYYETAPEEKINWLLLGGVGIAVGVLAYYLFRGR